MSPTKVYILGGSGFLGGLASQYLGARHCEVFNKRIDITDSAALKEGFGKFKPEVVINFAGARAYPNIDWCETHKEETVKLNVAGAINVMLAALEAGAYPIQISSGCIYTGGPEHAFTEEDEPNFYGSFYSRMRVVLQESLTELPVLQARIRMPICQFYHPRNLINKITSYPKVISIPNSATLVEDLLPALEKIISLRPLGVLNLTNEGYVEHSQLLEAYKKFVDPSHNYELINLEQLQGSGGITKAKRSNCVLSTEKARSLGILMPQLTDVKIEEIMKRYKASKLAAKS